MDASSEGALGPPDPELLGVVREEFGRVAYSHKAHEKLADRLQGRVLWEKRINAGLLTITAANTSAVALVFRDQFWGQVSAMALSLLTLFVTVYGLSRHREHLLEQHRRAAGALWLLRERYVHLIGDLKAGAVTGHRGRATRDALMHEAAQVYAAAPRTDGDAYTAAQAALKRYEELTFAAWEIDVMLPEALRSAPLPPAPQASPVRVGRPAWRRLFGR